MKPRKPTTVQPRKNRGGSDTLRDRGLVQLVIAISPEERQWIHAAAALAGLPANQWLRQLAVKAATETLGSFPGKE